QLKIIIVLKADGVICQRENFFIPLSPTPFAYLQSDSLRKPGESLDFRILPMNPLEDFYWTLQDSDPHLNLPQRLRSYSRQLNEKESVTRLWHTLGPVIALEPETLSACEEGILLSLAATGSLIIADPEKAAIPIRTWYRELNFEPEGEYRLMSVPPLPSLSLESRESPVLGRKHLFGREWTPIGDEEGLALGAYRPWGMGIIAVLNIPLEFLARDKNDNFLQGLLDEVFPNSELTHQLPRSLFSEAAVNWLESSNGFKVWPKSRVAAYLLGIILLSAAVIWWPIRNGRNELRWAGWLGVIALSSIVALSLLVGGSDRSSKALDISLHIRRLGEGDSGVQIRGALSLLSGEKRVIDLGFPFSMRWREQGDRPTSKHMFYDKQIQWKGLNLLPSQQMILEYADSEVAKPIDAEVRIGQNISVRLPKDWTEGEMALVLGRRVWFFGPGDPLDFSPGSGLLLASLKEEAGWKETLRSLCRREEHTMASGERCWLVRYDQDRDCPVNLPDDFMIQRHRLDLLECSPVFVKGAIDLPAGICNLRFLRPNGISSESHIAFDGLLFREEMTGRKMDLSFSTPPALKGFEAKSVELVMDILTQENQPEPKLQFLTGGVYQTLPGPLSGTRLLPPGAWSEGKVNLRLSPPARAPNSSLGSNTWQIRCLDIHLRGAVP
ncbi:MAG: hypothetical protein HQL31_06790, partial [Planctomycetes bacterium]|nr:hypothetical protein [Planctomycetota bacterium]